MSDYTPSATEIFGLYTARAKQLDKSESTAYQEFTRWLNEVKAQALEEAAETLTAEANQIRSPKEIA